MHPHIAHLKAKIKLLSGMLEIYFVFGFEYFMDILHLRVLDELQYYLIGTQFINNLFTQLHMYFLNKLRTQYLRKVERMTKLSWGNITARFCTIAYKIDFSAMCDLNI